MNYFFSISDPACKETHLSVPLYLVRETVPIFFIFIIIILFLIFLFFIFFFFGGGGVVISSALVHSGYCENGSHYVPVCCS